MAIRHGEWASIKTPPPHQFSMAIAGRFRKGRIKVAPIVRSRCLARS
jgi:hypothetical protein